MKTTIFVSAVSKVKQIIKYSYKLTIPLMNDITIANGNGCEYKRMIMVFDWCILIGIIVTNPIPWVLFHMYMSFFYMPVFRQKVIG